ncbi:rab-GTPase-TBC domain-containing protein [Multifurca ochricompacta]|uniref:Rab-GTPase-TBC domain-containing protein n=1 Tax=Multifurca ochricompacta TaxID=376703 RepID=A0AAD4M622_9AGAM|nr:rab-GTPase-TBC domain-containing protein [Multifurca ochricompacta]
MRAPDGSYEDGFTAPGGEMPPARTAPTGNLERNNPLSLHDENPWKEWFAAVELRRMIAQDVERTFPDIGYFRAPEVQSQLASILFLYAVLHPDVGYRQGMHELLAPLYYAVDYDSLPDTLGPGNLTEICARKWVAADAWALFDRIMGGVEQWYEWRQASEQQAPAVAGLVHLNGQRGMEPYITPILRACNRIQKVILKSVDPVLCERMQTEGIEPQMYGIRWLRLLFTREFSMHDVMVLWDGMFAVDPSLEVALWVCVAMLIRIRNYLITSDYSGQLTYLLRYPSNFTTTSTPFTMPHHAVLLLQQALTLQMSPTTSAGASVVLENRNLLDLPVEVSEPPPPAPRRRGGRSGGRRKSTSETYPSQPESGPNNRGSLGGQLNLPEFAKGLLDRGEALGINKTFMNAVSEIKKNLPDLAANLVRTPPVHGAAYAAYPLTDERPPEERPPWEPRTRFEVERDVAQLRAVQRTLGASVSWIVDTLLLDEGAGQSEERAKKVRESKREALEALAYVRDVLLSGSTDVDEERLTSEEDFKRRRKAQQEKQEQIAASTSTDGPRSSFNKEIISLPPVSRSAGPPPASNAPRPRAIASHSAPSPLSSSFDSPRPGTPKGGKASAFTVTPPAQEVKSLAPWNHTRSNFSSPLSGFSAEVPSLAPLPRASTTLSPPAAGVQNSSSTQTLSPRLYDPLGVLP